MARGRWGRNEGILYSIVFGAQKGGPSSTERQLGLELDDFSEFFKSHKGFHPIEL